MYIVFSIDTLNDNKVKLSKLYLNATITLMYLYPVQV